MIKTTDLHSCIRLSIWDVDTGILEAIERTLCIFTRVWGSITDNDREFMESQLISCKLNLEMELWRRTSESSPLAVIEATFSRNTLIRDPKITITYGICSRMPDDVLAATIAHELGHLYQFLKVGEAVSETDLLHTLESVEYSLVTTKTGRSEVFADETTQRWGYDPFRVHIWTSQHCYWKNRKLYLKKLPTNKRHAMSFGIRQKMIGRYYFPE